MGDLHVLDCKSATVVSQHNLANWLRRKLPLSCDAHAIEITEALQQAQDVEFCHQISLPASDGTIDSFVLRSCRKNQTQWSLAVRHVQNLKCQNERGAEKKMVT